MSETGGYGRIWKKESKRIVTRAFSMASTTVTIAAPPPPPLSAPSSFVSTAELKYGRNALANLFDVRAKEPSSSQRPFAHVLKTPNPADGFDIVTFSSMANAINRASWWLVNEVGLADGEVFGYMGPSDLRYLILSMAAAKTGRKVGFALYYI
jgi:hypothetical protein